RQYSVTYLAALSRPPRAPPSRTPFPYTTLFRSAFTTAKVIVARSFPPPGPTTSAERAPFDPKSSSSQHGTHVAGIAAGDANTAADRKSTRLNSSHQIISYAVFCLKKKIATNLTA